MLEIGALLDDPPWFGTRPCLPDMLPMVGAVPGQDGLWVNFGHGHQGFTLGPTTASLLVRAHAQGEGPELQGLSPSARL
jgi:D-amino-acid dehydrogenase